MERIDVPVLAGETALKNARIVISINTAWNVANFRAGLIKALIGKGFEVIVVAPPDDYVGLVESLGCRFIPIKMDNKGTNPILDLRLMIDYYFIFRNVRPLCYLGYTIKPNVYGSLAAGILGISSINNVAGLGTAFIKKTWLTRVVMKLYQWAFSKSFRVFFQNSDDLDYFVKSGLVRSDIAVRIPGSGIDTKRFVAGKFEKNKREPFRFILIARLLWDKGVGEYVEAARKIKSRHADVEVQLLGFLDVKNRTAISRDQVDQWESEGVLTYMGSTDNVMPYIDQADCVVLPSYREGVPRILLEAASMSKPVIATDAVGCRDAVDDGVTGYVAKVKDSSDLADKMEKMLLLSESERMEMGRRGRIKMEREFDESFVIDTYVDAIGKLCT